MLAVSDFAQSLVLAFTGSADLLLVLTPSLDGDEALLVALLEDGLKAGDDIGKMGLGGEGNVLLKVTGLGKHLEGAVLLEREAVVLGLDDDGSGDHISGTEGLFVLLVSEDVLGGDHGLGGSVLAGLGSGEGGNLAGESILHDDEGAGLHAASFSKLGSEGTRVSLIELVVITSAHCVVN
jgi:hypothetical protein